MQEKEFNANCMHHNGRSNGNLIILIVILFFISTVFALSLSLKSEFRTNKLCVDVESSSLKQQQSEEEKIWAQLECLSDPDNKMVKLFIVGIISVDELTMWVLGVDRRVVVLKMMIEKRMIQASDIANATNRSLQNISYAMRELEKRGLIQSLTPGKKTWKKFIPTEKGNEVFEKLKINHLIEK